MPRPFGRLPALAFISSLVLPAAAHALAVPQQLSPADGATLASRDITFTWGSVPAAGGAKYGIQIQYLDPVTGAWKSYKTQNDIPWYGGWYTFASFAESDHGRWRVRAMTAAVNSQYSGWRLFTFEPGAGGASGEAVVEYTQTIGLAAKAKVVHAMSCPDGTIVTGGGWRSGRPSRVNTYQSVQSNNGWVVGFENLTASSKTVDVHVECLRGVSGYAFSVAKREQLQPGGLGVPGATCPKGVLGGGGFRAPSRDLNVFASFPDLGPLTTWYAYARNEGNATRSLHAEAVCLVGTGAQVSFASSQSIYVGIVASATATATCPSGRLALSGGFGFHSSLGGMSSRGAGNGWQAAAYNDTSLGQPLLAHAMCARFD